MVDFDLEKAKKEASDINPGIEILELSCRTGAGIEAWTDWIEDLMKESRAD